MEISTRHKSIGSCYPAATSITSSPLLSTKVVDDEEEAFLQSPANTVTATTTTTTTASPLDVFIEENEANSATDDDDEESNSSAEDAFFAWMLSPLRPSKHFFLSSLNLSFRLPLFCAEKIPLSMIWVYLIVCLFVYLQMIVLCAFVFFSFNEFGRIFFSIFFYCLYIEKKEKDFEMFWESVRTWISERFQQLSGKGLVEWLWLSTLRAIMLNASCLTASPHSIHPKNNPKSRLIMNLPIGKRLV